MFTKPFTLCLHFTCVLSSCRKPRRGKCICTSLSRAKPPPSVWEGQEHPFSFPWLVEVPVLTPSQGNENLKKFPHLHLYSTEGEISPSWEQGGAHGSCSGRELQSHYFLALHPALAAAVQLLLQRGFCEVPVSPHKARDVSTAAFQTRWCSWCRCHFLLPSTP